MLIKTILMAALAWGTVTAGHQPEFNICEPTGTLRGDKRLGFQFTSENTVLHMFINDVVSGAGMFFGLNARNVLDEGPIRLSFPKIGARYGYLRPLPGLDCVLGLGYNGLGAFEVFNAAVFRYRGWGLLKLKTGFLINRSRVDSKVGTGVYEVSGLAGSGRYGIEGCFFKTDIRNYGASAGLFAFCADNLVSEFGIRWVKGTKSIQRFINLVFIAPTAEQ